MRRGGAGTDVEVSISYASDDTVQRSGLFVDDVVVSTGEGTTSFENDGDTLDGWTIPGAPEGSAPNENDWIAGTVADGPETAGDVAQGSFNRESEILSFLGENFGPYPFSSSGGIVDDIEGVGFALETQTRPVYSRDFFGDSISGDNVVVHELAHQWYGDSLAVEAWQHIWLNEGFATYAEWLWSEHEGLGTAQENFDFFYGIFDEDHPFWSLPGSRRRVLDMVVHSRQAGTRRCTDRSTRGDRNRQHEHPPRPSGGQEPSTAIRPGNQGFLTRSGREPRGLSYIHATREDAGTETAAGAHMDSASPPTRRVEHPPRPRAHLTTGRTMPVGRVAFFFTDLEGSTKQWEAHPELMHLAVSRHDELMVESIERWNGIVFSTGGDGFVAVFPSVADAVAAGTELQRVILEEPWPAPIVIKARMAAHVGVANLRGTNYFGSVVNRTARIMATGHGGQLLLSDEARNACPEAAVIDLGIHYLKDLSAPEHVWQVAIEGLDSEFPPLRSLDRTLASLPTQLSGFVGRTREIGDVLELLDANRLVTLRGLGGIGKTRLSLQVAAEAVGQSVDVVRFVALSPLADSASLPFHVLKSLGLSQPAGQTPTETIATSIGSTSTLIVFDNCEHLDGAVPTLAVELLGACPKLRVLATSRNALGVAGERVYAIEALPTGTHDSPAEQIFIARAQAANASVDFSGDRGAVVSRICRRLDGIPLAIELAAARVRSMPPEEIEQHLDERFRLLRSTKGFDERHRVLYDTLEWSYQHLDAELQVLLRRLSVFAGQFTAADAVEVVGDDDHDLLMISEQLDELVDHSLVIADVSTDVAEYRLLETVREFGAAALQDEREPLHARHAQYFASLSRRLFEQMLSPLEGAAVQQRNRVHDDIRAAYMWSRAHQRVDLVADFVARAAIDVLMHGRIEVAVWATEAVENLDLSSMTVADRCCLYQTAACLEINEGRADRARELVGRAETLSLELDPAELPADLVGGSSVCFFLGQLDDGDAIAERLGSRLAEVGPSTALAITIISRSAIHGYWNRPDTALEFARTALTMITPDDVPTWRTLAEWQVARYSDLEPIELADRVTRYRDRFLQVRNSFLAATATRQLVGLESARQSAQSRAMANAVEGIAKLSMADPREAIGWMMQSAILLLRAGHHRPALTILGWERLNRVAPVHPDQLAAIGRLMPSVDEALDAAAIAEATAALTSANLREAVDFTRAALVEASHAAAEAPVAG